MDIELLGKEKGKVRFVAKGTSPAVMNAYRRIVVNDVPAMAIDTVEIVENSSALYDEVFAHRLGLVVLKTDLTSYFLKETCKCKGEGCARCTLDLTLEAEGPGIVYAEQLQSKDPAVVPMYPKTPIVKLIEGQRVKVHAKAILGRGREHIKYSPGLLWYQGYPHVKVKNVKNAEGVAAVCPTKVFGVDGGKLKVKKEDACILCMACVDASHKEVDVKGSDTDFIVTLEPWGQLTPEQIVESIADAVHENLDVVSDAIKKLK